MNWFRENRFLGTFLVAFGVALFLALWFFFSAKSDWDEASNRFKNAVTESNRLERLAPYPNADNLRKMKAHAEDYANALAKLKAELANRGAPAEKIQPNEFQSRLRVAMSGITDKARENKLKLPDKFYLGFDEYTAALPASELAATLLGQELVQIEWLMNSLVDARADALISFHRTALREERGIPPVSSAKPPVPTVSIIMLERNVVELTFVSTPAAARKVINQIAGANQEFCIIRLLHVRNEKDKGPPRESADETSASKATPVSALNFIVGTEKIETTATIEFVRFTL